MHVRSKETPLGRCLMYWYIVFASSFIQRVMSDVLATQYNYISCFFNYLAAISTYIYIYTYKCIHIYIYIDFRLFELEKYVNCQVTGLLFTHSDLAN